MSIYVAGSLAFDRIMSFSGKFSDHILPEKLHILNVCFFISHMEERRGGTGGNIAYSLALMGEKPRIVSTVGKDFAEYRQVLQDMGLSTSGIRVDPTRLTAFCYITTDQDNNQITGFNPAAMETPCDYTFEDLQAEDWAIISPTNLEDMQGFPRLYREKGVKYIYDPGQQIPVIGGDELLAAIAGSTMLISNDYELELICRSTGRTKAELMALTGCVITTMGEKGSMVECASAEGKSANRGVVGIAEPVQVVDPTGAGDAFRSGLVKGLVHGLDTLQAARLGATCASFCVEKCGTQEHVFTFAEFAARHETAFGETPGLVW